MSGYISPAGDAEGGLPDGGLLAGGLPERGLPEAGLPGVYINPDNLPTVNTSHIENDYDEHYDNHYDVAPARGTIGKTAKLMGTFKKSGKNNMDPPGPPIGESLNLAMTWVKLVVPVHAPEMTYHEALDLGTTDRGGTTRVRPVTVQPRTRCVPP